MPPASRYDRQIRALGAHTQERLQSSHACIVGLGGIGSQVLHALAYLGVERFLLIDEDSVDPSNLNRLLGATVTDVGHRKVDIAAKAIRNVNENAVCQTISKNLRSREALQAAQRASVVFGCVDNDGARLVLMELCCAYELPLVDMASEFLIQADKVQDFGGRVVVAQPGDFCLQCAAEIDMEAAKAELEPEAVRKVREEHGYGFGPTIPSPAVVSLNGIIANIGVTEFLMVVSGIREPFRKTIYKGMRGIVQVSRDVRRPGCFNCEYLVGKGDTANLYRYAISD